MKCPDCGEESVEVKKIYERLYSGNPIEFEYSEWKCPAVRWHWTFSNFTATLLIMRRKILE